MAEAIQKNVDEDALVENVAKSIIALEEMKGQKLKFLKKDKERTKSFVSSGRKIFKKATLTRDDGFFEEKRQAQKTQAVSSILLQDDISNYQKKLNQEYFEQKSER